MAAILLKMRNTVCLEQNLDEGMLSRVRPRNRVGDPVLAHLDLTEFQPRDGRIVDMSFEGRSVERIDIELAAKFGQRIGPALYLLLGRQSGGAKGMYGIWHDPTTWVNRDQNMTPGGAIGHRKVVFTSFRTIIGAARLQSSDLVQTPSRGLSCRWLGGAAPAGVRGAGLMASACVNH